MKGSVFYTKNARKELRKLESKASRKIVEKVAFYCSQNKPLKYSKKLKPPFADLYRFKVGDYRVVFEFDNKGNIFLLTVLKVGHRKDVYE